MVFHVELPAAVCRIRADTRLASYVCRSLNVNETNLAITDEPNVVCHHRPPLVRLPVRFVLMTAPYRKANSLSSRPCHNNHWQMSNAFLQSEGFDEFFEKGIAYLRFVFATFLVCADCSWFFCHDCLVGKCECLPAFTERLVELICLL